MKDVKKALEENNKSCLKIDIDYPSIDHEILKEIIQRKIKCKRTNLLSEIIDSGWFRLEII